MSFGQLSERKNNMVLSVRCDRRTLGTILKYFHNRGEHINSLGHLVNLALDSFRFLITSSKEEEDVISVEDATYLLKQVSKAALTPGGKYGRTYLRQLEKEHIYADGGSLMPSTKKSMETPVGDSIKEETMSNLEREFHRIAPSFIANKNREEEEKIEEDMKQAQKRREEETQQMKTGLSQVPDSVVKSEK